MAKKVGVTWTMDLDLVAEIEKRASQQEMKASAYVNDVLRVLLEMPEPTPIKPKKIEELDQDIAALNLKLTELKKQRDKEKEKEKQKKLKEPQRIDIKTDLDLERAYREMRKHRK